MPRTPDQQRLFEISGKVESNDPWIGFLYILMRDHLPPGVVESILREHVLIDGPDKTDTYTNGWLAKYAEFIVQRVQEQACKQNPDPSL